MKKETIKNNKHLERFIYALFIIVTIYSPTVVLMSFAAILGLLNLNHINKK